MNDLGLILVGVAARATVLAVVGLGALAAVRRRGPAAGALAGSTTLAVMLGVAVLAGSPWPRWWSTGRAGATATPSVAVSRPMEAEGQGPPRVSKIARPAATADAPVVDWASFVAEFRRELADPSPLVARGLGWRWPAWVAGAFLAGLAVALIRLGLGIWAVATLRARSRAIDDPALLALVAALRAAMGIHREVVVHATDQLTTPATVGWRQPVVLLPVGWELWDEGERRVVLAHELAHVARGDYLTGLIAQLSLSVHFYHPLAHTLAGRLRLQQELAADAWGARLAGGRRAYLTTLANLALRHDPRPPAWPARPFLPSRGTFLRRIEMLRDPKILDQPPMPPRGRALTVAALVAAGLLVAGLRGPGGTDQALAQAPTAPAPAAAPVPTVLDPLTLSSDVHLVVDFRPASLLKNPEFRKLADQVPADGPKEFKAVASGQIDQILILGVDDRPAGVPGPPNAPPAAAFIIRAARAYDWNNFISAPVEKVEWNGLSYLKSRRGPAPACYVELDNRTLLICPEIWVGKLGVDPRQPGNRHGWDGAWKQLSPGTFRMAIDTPWLARSVEPIRQGMAGAIIQMFGPLLNQTQAYALNLNLADGLTLDALAISGTPAEAQGVAATIQALVTLAGNAMPAVRAQAEKGPPGAGRTLIDAANALDAMLATAKVDQDQAIARLRARTDSLAPITALLAPAVQASTEATKRSTSVNNLKQIALAMHNFASVQPEPRFPPAVLYGPNGKTPYSWRVALLPYLGQQTLYNDYKFDEPWDGPNNRKLLERMPDVYHDPSDIAAKLGETSYFVPTGPMTVFPDRKDGMKFMEITDGTSNTILVVESRRPIAWTDPRDIAIPARGVLPALGGNHPGGFNVSFADGAVRFLSQTIDPTVLHALFSAMGGEVMNTNNDAIKAP